MQDMKSILYLIEINFGGKWVNVYFDRSFDTQTWWRWESATIAELNQRAHTFAAQYPQHSVRVRRVIEYA